MTVPASSPAIARVSSPRFRPLTICTRLTCRALRQAEKSWRSSMRSSGIDASIASSVVRFTSFASACFFGSRVYIPSSSFTKMTRLMPSTSARMKRPKSDPCAGSGPSSGGGSQKWYGGMEMTMGSIPFSM